MFKNRSESVSRERARTQEGEAAGNGSRTVHQYADPVRIAYVRVEDGTYPRNSRIRAALTRGFPTSTIKVIYRSRRRSRPVSYLIDIGHILQQLGRHDVFVVAEFSLPFVPLVWLVARLSRAVFVVDHFVGKYETKVEDWGTVPPRSVRARWFRLVDMLSVRLADIVLVDTDVRASRLVKRYSPRGRVMNLPVGAPAWARPAPPQHHAGALRVLYYGNYLPLHGLQTIVEAAAKSSVALTMVGTGGLRRSTEDAVDRLGIRASTVFIDWLDTADLIKTIHDHDVVLGIFGTTPKARTVIANKVWQGLAAGRVLVTAESPALSEIAEIVGAQLVTVPAADSTALAARFDDLRSQKRHPDWSTSALSLEEYVGSRYRSFFEQLQLLLSKRRRRDNR